MGGRAHGVNQSLPCFPHEIFSVNTMLTHSIYPCQRLWTSQRLYASHGIAYNDAIAYDERRSGTQLPEPRERAMSSIHGAFRIYKLFHANLMEEEKRGRQRKENSLQEMTSAFLTSVMLGSQFIVYSGETDSFFIKTQRSKYTYVSEKELEYDIYNYLVVARGDRMNIGIKKIKEIIDALKNEPRVKLPFPFVENGIFFTDGFYSFEDHLLHKNDLEPTPLQISTVAFDFSWADASVARSAVFDSFLRSLFVKPIKNEVGERDTVETEKQLVTDELMISYVQELVGNCLVPTTAACAAFFLVGEGANGKSTFLDVLTSLFGERSVTSYSIESLTNNRFTTAALVGKRLNACAEEESKYLRSDKFKALVSGDMVTAERKYGDSFQFRPQVKFVFSTNEMPTFDGLNKGLRRRIKVVPFFRSFDAGSKERDPHIIQKLKKEMPAIVRWAIEGARRIAGNGYAFTVEPEASRESFIEFENESSSPVAYFRETYDVSDDEIDAKTKAEVYSHYKDVWCPDVGKKPMNRNNFWKQLRPIVPASCERVIWRDNKTQRAMFLKEKTIAIPNVPDPFSNIGADGMVHF